MKTSKKTLAGKTYSEKSRKWCCFFAWLWDQRENLLKHLICRPVGQQRHATRETLYSFSSHSKTIFSFHLFFVTLKGSLREKTVHVEIWSPATRYTLYVQSISHPFMNRPNGRPLKTSWISEGRTFNLSSISFLYMYIYIYIYIYPGSPKAVLQTAVYGKTVFWEFRAKTVIQGLRT